MKYKVGDKVRIKNTDIEGTIESIIRGQLIVNCKSSKIHAWPEDVEIILNGKEVMLKLADIELPSGTTDIWECPKGYQFVDENGNIINAQKIVLEKKQKEYPKTYEECCKVMNYCCNPVSTKTTHKEELIRKFQFLLLYRDAYWKIAGDEMGFGKPWEPDWTNFVQDKHCIYVDIGDIILAEGYRYQHVLAFPTAKMRDTFYENFKEEIKMCKELL